MTRQTRLALYIVEAVTHFNAARFLPVESTGAIWNTFLKIWACMYVGMPNSMLADQGSAFLSDEWRHACELNSIHLIPTGTESHNSLGSGEAYHAYLRWTFNEIQEESPSVTDDVLLALSVKAINDCTGPKELCPTLLVFGSVPQLPSPSLRDHPTIAQRHRAVPLARAEYERIVIDQRIQMAANKPTPVATNATYAPGDLAYVYRERLRRFTGPHLVASVHGKNLRLNIGDRYGPREFNIA